MADVNGRLESCADVGAVHAELAVRRAVRDAVEDAGVTCPQTWQIALGGAAVVLHDVAALGQLASDLELVIADAALGGAAAAGVELDEAIRIVREECRFDVYDGGPQSTRSARRMRGVPCGHDIEDVRDNERKGEAI